MALPSGLTSQLSGGASSPGGGPAGGGVSPTARSGSGSPPINSPDAPPPPPASPYLTEVVGPGGWVGSSGVGGWSGTHGSAASPGGMPPRAAMPDLVPGTVLEQYEIEGVLGRGGYGVVYRARHRTVGDGVPPVQWTPHF